MRIIAVVTGEARLAQKYEREVFLEPMLTFIAHRFAPRPISPPILHRIELPLVDVISCVNAKTRSEVTSGRLLVV